MSSSKSKLTKSTLLIAIGVPILVLALVIWMKSGGGDPPPQVEADPFADINPSELQPSFLLVRYVAAKGGDEFHRNGAIEWLSEQARLHQPLRPEQEDMVFGMIESDGHPDWEMAYKQWLFNDAFNCLRMADDQARLTRLLLELALDHEDSTLRLYALQHLDLQRSSGRLPDAMADQVVAALTTMAQDGSSPVAGTALVNLTTWEGRDTQPGQSLVDLALEIAADSSRADGIRVTALHSIDEHSLPLARDLAPDTKQPVHVRKAAIALIGEHGAETDVALLKQLADENFRIAQAAKPALEAIRVRGEQAEPRTLISL